MKFILSILFFFSLNVMGQTRLKSCIGCGGASQSTHTYYARYTTAQITVIDCNQSNTVNYLTGFTFQAINMRSAQSNEITVKVFPNPTVDYLNIELSATGCNIRIIDLSGKEIQNFSGGVKNLIATTYWKSGIYFLQIQVDHHIRTFKIIKI